MKVLIDAGHGIDTPGKRSPDGAFREYLWNRQVADKVCSHLEGEIDYGLVVTETNDIPLKVRANRVNAICKELGKDNVILVSIHANAAGNGEWMNAQGWSCYTTPGVTESDTLAECFYSAFTQAFPERKIRTDMRDGDRDIEANFYILARTQCAAVLLENFFYDNREECRWLLQDETKERIAVAIAQGIKDYIKAKG